MRVIEQVREAHVVLAFLRAESRSPRYASTVTALLAQAGANGDLIERPDLSSANDNATRARVLGAYRGWPDRLLFLGFPRVVTWFRAVLDGADLADMRYVNDDFRLPGHEGWDSVCWFDLSAGTRLVTRGAQTVRLGDAPPGYETVFTDIRATASAIRAGVPQGELILARASPLSPLILVEGHTRATAHALVASESVDALFAEAPGLEGWHMNA